MGEKPSLKRQRDGSVETDEKERHRTEEGEVPDDFKRRKAGNASPKAAADAAEPEKAVSGEPTTRKPVGTAEALQKLRKALQSRTDAKFLKAVVLFERLLGVRMRRWHTDQPASILVRLPGVAHLFVIGTDGGGQRGGLLRGRDGSPVRSGGEKECGGREGGKAPHEVDALS
eukprot:scaffold407_cov251-Pinguiococcus_pyrenoidosus.AAC.7